jgi:hypothetical protein
MLVAKQLRPCPSSHREHRSETSTDFIISNKWPSSSPGLSPLDYSIMIKFLHDRRNINTKQWMSSNEISPKFDTLFSTQKQLGQVVKSKEQSIENY